MEELESSTEVRQSERWKTPKDFLEPQFYPDPGQFLVGDKMTKDDNELLKNLASGKAAIRVLAPYLKIMRKEKMRMEKAIDQKRKEGRPKLDISFEKRSKEQILCTFPDLGRKVELATSIGETGDVLKALLRANYAMTYLVNPDTQEIYPSTRNVANSTVNLSFKIGQGTTIGAYAAFTKHHVVSSKVGADQRFPQGLGSSGIQFKYAMCVPIKTTDEKVVALYEFARDDSQAPFSVKDIQTVLALTGWIGVAITQNELYMYAARMQELAKYLAELTNYYHSGKVNNDKTMTDFVIFAREVIEAEKCSLYVVDKMTKESMLMEQYEQGKQSSRQLYKKRTKKLIKDDGSILGKAVFGQTVVNDKSSSGNTHMDEDFRSVLCAPILCSKETLGAIKLTNKKRSDSFDQIDKEILETFATFCAINLNYLKSYEEYQSTEARLKVMNEMLFHHIRPCSHDQDAAKGFSYELPENFFTFTWYPSPDEVPRLVEYTINMFHEVLGESFMALNNIPKFVLTVRNCYRPNPYHNFLHAFGVAHAMGNIVSRYHNIFTGVERKSLMVAALCHDVDHRGYNNNFVQLTRHHLASLYETSPLENHHYAVTKIILEQCGMFKYIKSDIFNEILEEIYHAIIATDLSLYFQSRMEFLQIADEKTFTFKDPAHRRLVKSLMMTACDLSGQTKPLPICKKITEDVYEEFYQQGDVEKKMGYVPLPTMDRSKRSMIEENQVQFLSVVVLPCVETVSRIFSTLGPMVWDCRLLLNQWRELAESKKVDNL